MSALSSLPAHYRIERGEVAVGYIQCLMLSLSSSYSLNMLEHALDQRFSTQTTPRPVFLTNKIPRPAIEKLKK